MNICKCLFVFSIWLGPSLSHAGSTLIGNGGEGVVVGGKLRLLDFVEGGIGLSTDCGAPDPEIKRVLGEVIPFVRDEADWTCLSRAFAGVARESSELRRLILRVGGMYRWILVETSLSTLPLESSYVDINKLSRKTMAIRHLDEIRVDKGAWESLRPIDRAGLVFHEIVYSIVRPVCPEGKYHCAQEPLVARGLTARAFSNTAAGSAAGKMFWTRRMAGDGLDDLDQNAEFSPIFYSIPSEPGVEQFGIFLRRRKGGFERLVRAAYRDILLRAASDSEAIYWTSRMGEQGIKCEELVSLFLKTPEYLNFVAPKGAKPFDRQRYCARVRRKI